MNLTVEQLVARAIKVLKSGQPGLATLYMRRALVILAVDRTERLVPPAASALNALVKFFDSVGQSAVAFIDAVFNGLTGTTQADFTLVGEP